MGMFDTTGRDRAAEARSENTVKKLERMKKAMRHEEPDRVPISDFFWGSFIRRWREELVAAFPDLVPIELAEAPVEVLERGRRIAEQLGWHVERMDREAFVIEDGRLTGMRFSRLEYAEDGDGRLRSSVVEEVVIPCDDVILAIGQDNAFPWIEDDLGIEFDKVRPLIADTSSLGYTFLTGGSRATFSSGMAAISTSGMRVHASY